MCKNPLLYTLSVFLIFTLADSSATRAQDLSKAFEYYNAENYKNAALEFENSLPGLKEQYGENDTSYYSKIVLYTALSFQNDLNTEKAIPYYLSGIAIFKTFESAADNSWYYLFLNTLANIYYNTNKFKEAEPLFVEAKEVCEKTFGKEHINYAINCKKLSDLYEDLSAYQKAETLYVEALSAYEKILGKEHADYADCINNLAVLYYNTADYQKAEPLYIEAMSIREKLFGKDHPSYGSSCNNLAALYQEMGLYKRALKLYLEDKKITGKTLGKEHSEYAISCSNLAALYETMGDNKQAELLYLEAKNIEEKVLGKEDPDYATSCNSLANLYFNSGNYKSAEALYQEAKNIRQKVFGTNHPAYAISCDNLASLYQELGNYPKAESFYLEAKGIREKVLGNKHPDFAITCNNLASLYQDMGFYNKAEILYLEAKKIYEEVLGKKHLSYAAICNGIATLYQEMGNYQTAEALYLEADKIISRILGTKHISYAENCAGLASLYHDMGNYEKAEDLYIEVKDIKKDVLGEKHDSYGASCSSLATLYKDIGNFQQAEQLFLEAKFINNEVFGNKHPNYAKNCNNLAELYRITGKYSKAEPLYFEAKRVEEQFLGKEHPDYASTCNNIALLYTAVGNYPKAFEFYEEALQIEEKVYGIEHPSYSKSCNNIGLLCIKMGYYDYAESFFTKAKNIREKVLGKEHPSYAISCNNLALLYYDLGKLLKADSLFNEAKDIYEKAYGKNHQNYAKSCGNLALVYKDLGDSAKSDKERANYYKKAKRLNIEAKEIRANLLGKQHPDYAQSCNSLAGLYEAIGNHALTVKEKTDAYQKAESLYLEANSILNFLSAESAGFMSEKERQMFLEVEISENFEAYHAYFLIKRKDNKTLTGTVYNNALNMKGQLLKSAIAVRKAVLQSGDTALIINYNKMNNYGKILAKQYTLPLDKRRQDIAQLEEKVNLLEKEITKKSAKLPGFENLSHLDLTWQDIKKSLDKEESTIEFIHFYSFDEVDSTVNRLYYALVLRKDFEYPKAIYLFKEKQLQHLLKRGENEDDFSFVKKLYSHHSAQSDSLYHLVFSPIESSLKGIKTIYLSPAGLLNRIAFDALTCDSVNILSDKYNIFYTSTTATSINKVGLYPKDIKSTALFGGIEYTLSTEEMIKIASAYKPPEEDLTSLQDLPGLRSLDSLSRNITWNYLPGSLKETEEIQDVLKNKGVEVHLYKKELGSEEQFKALENAAPSILHVSTHGFYFGDDKKSEEYKSIIDKKVEFAHSLDPLLRSGFILAGGNTAFQGSKVPEGVEDGVLTALEISRLNFFKTKLVVLSACQTGLGDVWGNEGVYGLQRSFKMAGAEYLLFSLWEVPDYQTRQLMTNFYQNWFSGMEIRAAFKKAQNYLKTKYADVEGAAFTWAAFVLMK